MSTVSLENLRRQALDLRDSVARGKWIRELRRTNQIDKEQEKALAMFFYVQDYLDKTERDLYRFCRRVLHKIEVWDNLIKDGGDEVDQTMMMIAALLLNSISFLEMSSELGLDHQQISDAMGIVSTWPV